MSALRTPAILLGGSHIALAVARSLGRSGVPVYVLGDAKVSAAKRSRFCHRFVDTQEGEGVEGRWLDWLESQPFGGVVLPCNDDALAFVVRNRRALMALGHMPSEADDEVALAMLDKHRTYELARALGIRTPITASLGGAEDLDDAVNELGFPMALKPLDSYLFARVFGTRKKLVVANNRGELRQAFAELAGLGLKVLATEIVPGPDHSFCSYYSYIDLDGEPLFHFTKRKLRQYPTQFGNGCYQVTSWEGDSAVLGLRFFQGVGLRGLGNVEFKRDSRDGELTLIECNHRFTQATEQVVRAGLDLPLIVYSRALGLPISVPHTFREGVRLWHPADDIRALLAYRKRGELSAREWIASLLHRQMFPILRWNDPLPALASWSGMARKALRGVRDGHLQEHEAPELPWEFQDKPRARIT